ncbi:hypothetical protein [Streptomyces xantholiticus]|uniref:Tox-PL domain-containing protein n=1 Tax=Streptomyces xantholiticus TaxID=68285 RepID=A0ABV1UWM2_9ACTN
MSGNIPVDPYEIPHFTGSWCELDLRVKALSGASTKIPTAAGDVHTTFGGLRAYYEAPEAEQLFAVTEPVKSTAQLIGSDLSVIAGALRTYAQDAQPLAKQLDELRAEAEAFRAKVADDDEWREDGDLIDENLERRNKVAEVWAAFQDVELACHNKIVALVDGTPLKKHDGSDKKGMYGYDAEALKQAKSLPWGDAVEESTPGWQVWEHAADFVTGFVVDGVWATVVGLGTLAGFNGWDAAGEAWSGLATLGEGLGYTIIFGIDSPYWTTPEDELPPRLRESRVAIKETGKALLAWDDWDAHPGRAAGAVTFNVLTTVFTGGAGGAASTAGKAGAAARALAVAGKVSRVVDPMTYVFKGAGAGLTKLGDVMAGLRGMGRIEVPPLPEGAIALPPGAYKLPDGTLHLPEGAAMPEGAFAVPKRTVLLPEGTPVPTGAVDLGDGMVQLPRRGEVPAGSVAVPEGTIKVPGGATALPPGTAPAGTGSLFSPEGHLLATDGSLLQHADDAPKATTPDPAAGADVSSPTPPVRQPALVGAGASDDAARLGTGPGDDGIRLGDDAPGTGAFPDRMRGGGVGGNMPSNSLDNGVGGGASRAGDNTPTGGADGHADTPSTGSDGRDVPGGSTVDNGLGGGSRPAGPPGAGALDQVDSSADDTVGGTGHPDADGTTQAGPGADGSRAGNHADTVERQLTAAERKKLQDRHVWLANNNDAWRERYYRPDGHRKDKTVKVDGVELPILKKLPDGTLVAKYDLPHGPSEVKHSRTPLKPDSAEPSVLPMLNESAKNSRVSVDLTNAENAFKENPSPETQAVLDAAKNAYRDQLGDAPNNSKHSERLGERASRYHAIPKLFNNPEWVDLPKTPNGANMLDSLYKLSDEGHYLVVEEKGPKANLNPPRLGAGSAANMMVKQGTRPYLETIFHVMWKRGGRDRVLAEALFEALEDGKLQYVLVKGKESAGSYDGAVLEHLKIY